MKFRGINEGMSIDIELNSTDDVRKFIEKILTKGIKSGDILPGEYMVVDDDGIMIGNESDFDADVLLYAIKIDDIVNFSDGSVELYNIDDKELFHNIF